MCVNLSTLISTDKFVSCLYRDTLGAEEEVLLFLTL